MGGDQAHLVSSLNREFSLENMTPAERAGWVAAQVGVLSFFDTNLDHVLKALNLGVAWDGELKKTLITAASRRIVGLIEPLIDSGLDINETDKNGKTALTAAAEAGNVTIVNKLMARKALLVHPRCLEIASGESPLEMASYLNKHEIMEILIKAQAPLVVTRCGQERHVLSRALESEPFVAEDHDTKYKTLKILLDAGAYPFAGIDMNVENGPVLVKDGLAVLEEDKHQPSIDLIKAAREKYKQELLQRATTTGTVILSAGVGITKSKLLKI